MKGDDEDWQSEVSAELDEALGVGGTLADITPPGWLTPAGDFIPSEPTPAVRICGMELGGHEAAAIGWLPENRPGLFEKLEDQRIAEGYQIYLDSDGTDMIKQFMFANGFLRLGPADEEMEVEGTPNEIQEALMRSAAQRIGVEIRRILPSD
jgi:hypothetical protein